MPPSISVIIPCHNHARFLGDAVESVLSQNAGEIEVIIVDDGSTDTSAHVAARYTPRVQYIWQANSGPAIARNTGLRIARGEYVSFLDADDRWIPGFAREMKHVISSSGVDVVGCGWRYIDEQGNLIGEPVRIPPGLVTASDLVLQNRFVVHAALSRREMALRIGGFGINLPLTSSAEDWHFWIRMALGGAKMITIAKPLVEYRLLAESRSHRDPSGRLRSLSAVLDAIFQLPDLPIEIAVLKNQAYGLCHAYAGAGCYATDDRIVGQMALRRAVQIYPAVLQDVGIYYAIACAHQPKAFRGGAKYLDISRAEQDLLSAVRAVCAESTLDPQWCAMAWSQAFRWLAQLAFLAGDGKRMRVYLKQMIKSDYRQLSKYDLHLAAKALIGPRNWQKLRRIKAGTDTGEEQDASLVCNSR